MSIRPLTVRVTDAAAALGVARSTIYRWSKTNPEFPEIFRLGPSTSRIYLPDLEAWVAAHKTKHRVVGR
jgi:predicted DNA-binding transcriptional regulator AlpA